jgi:hypothetical protein
MFICIDAVSQLMLPPLGYFAEFIAEVRSLFTLLSLLLCYILAPLAFCVKVTHLAIALTVGRDRLLKRYYLCLLPSAMTFVAAFGKLGVPPQTKIPLLRSGKAIRVHLWNLI